MAIVLALFLKHFVIETYKIPTGSMQPTLIGDQDADIKDRILVDKLSYAFRQPRRWEVAVFRYPLDRSKNFVKRIAGVGPEELRFEHGDLWRRAAGEAWQIVRRPASVMSEHWRRLDALAPEQSRWIPQDLPTSSRWEAEGRTVRARGPGLAAFRGGHESILDDYFDGYPEELLEWLPAAREHARNQVGDLRVTGRIQALPGLERCTVVLREGARRYRFELAGPAAAPDARTRIDAGPSARPDSGSEARPASSDYRLPAERSVAFALENLDDRLALEIEGEELLALAIEAAEDQFSSVTLELAGAGADLDELMVWRDIYYETRTPPIQIPSGSYYMLGDNTQDSSDSREWTYVTFDVTGEDGPSRRVRGNWRDGENPRTLGYGEIDGPLTYLVDEWGEKHWFARGQARRASPEAAPFVPRALIQGKALAVFWPLDPLRGIWRLKWVN